MSMFWSVIVALVIFLNIIGCYLLIRWVAKPSKGEVTQGEETGHVWDEDLTELNNPMPRWWLFLFYISIVYGLLYLVFYGGFANNSGLLGWSSEKEYIEELADADAVYGPIFSKYADVSIEDLSKDEKAKRVGQRLFVTYCSQCHGSDAGGARGFPDLTDNDWIWGGSPDEIYSSILNGRTGTMPAWGSVIDKQKIGYLVDYIVSLSGRVHKATDAQRGKVIFSQYCVACHAANATGNKLFGAPNLADKVWLYGGSRGRIMKSIVEGRTGHMPTHKNFLGEDKVHLLAGYIYGLSKED
ncbi:MAG: cytochrome-c oxidase, cbb3-type subunit III [Piscirickettsiaceae bacterium]|nr:MAG: cytochrome-c oxidase, cbb3-type subunit III [Piscirickettsiaceae bacterium]